jgi:probable F420-dependent oxidoreductase
MFANTGAYAEPDNAAALAVAAEECGLESIWAIEHVVVPDGYASKYPYHDSGQMPFSDDMDLPDPLIWLSYIAAVTNRVKLGTGILILPQRNPVVLAKELATLAQLSKGRFELGIGVGWLQEEFDILDVPFARRGKRTDEMVAAMQALWSEPKATTFESEFYNFSGAMMHPKPPGNKIPIVVGGHSEIAARRAGRYGDGFFPGNGDVDELMHIREVMRDAAVDYGRDPDAIEFTAGAWSPRRGELDEVRRMEELGIDRLIVTPPSSNPDQIRQAMEQLGEKIAPVATT